MSPGAQLGLNAWGSLKDWDSGFGTGRGGGAEMSYFGPTGSERAPTSPMADCQKRGPLFLRDPGCGLRSGPLRFLGANTSAATDLREAPLFFIIYLVPSKHGTDPFLIARFRVGSQLWLSTSP